MLSKGLPFVVIVVVVAVSGCCESPSPSPPTRDASTTPLSDTDLHSTLLDGEPLDRPVYRERVEAGLSLDGSVEAGLSLDGSVEARQRIGRDTAMSSVNVGAVIDQVRGARRWKAKVSSPTQEFIKSIRSAFDGWSKALIQLSNDEKRSDADRVCRSIIELRDHLGPKLLPVERYDSFIRDRFWIGQHRVESAQFFEPLRYHSTDDRIMKIIRFSVYSEAQVSRRYYLERSTLGSSILFVLGRANAETQEHEVAEEFGTEQPTYWLVKERVIADLGVESSQSSDDS